MQISYHTAHGAGRFQQIMPTKLTGGIAEQNGIRHTPAKCRYTCVCVNTNLPVVLRQVPLQISKLQAPCQRQTLGVQPQLQAME